MTPHGERRTYLRGCHCHECTAAHTAYCKRTKLLQARGHAGYVPHHKVAALLDQLNAAGYSDHAVAVAAGLSSSTLSLVRRRKGRMRVGTFARLLAVPEPRVALVPADLTRRRLRSLMRNGWTLTEIEHRAGVRSLKGGKWRTEPRLRAELAAAVRDLYRRLGDAPGPSREAAGRGKAAGWPLPAEWDDPGTLAWPDGHVPTQPVETPIVDVVAVDRWLAGDRTVVLSLVEKREAIRRAPRFGVSHQELMRRWKWSGTTFSKHRAIALDEKEAA